jgi:hypothetical protein
MRPAQPKVTEIDTLVYGIDRRNACLKNRRNALAEHRCRETTAGQHERPSLRRAGGGLKRRRACEAAHE